MRVLFQLEQIELICPAVFNRRPFAQKDLLAGPKKMHRSYHFNLMAFSGVSVVSLRV
jgi:hypothetical protein